MLKTIFLFVFPQMFIFMTVSSFGPLTCSIITTTRKFFTILASTIIFPNPVTSLQWLGTTLVFLGLCLDSVYGKELKKSADEYL
jgi:UDP-galactose transporter B1